MKLPGTVSTSYDLSQIFLPIKADLVQFEAHLESVLATDSKLIAAVTTHWLNRRGKRLRPAIVFLSSRLFNGFSERASYAALAIELIHNATLLHDDVVDVSLTRRGQATVNAQWNNLVAVLMGDYFFSKAFTLLVKAETEGLMESVSTATERVSVGQLLEIQESHNYLIAEEQYFQIISEKTASLFAASAEAGALLTGGRDQERRNLREYGEKLGMAFQIADDVLDLVGKAEKTGKGLGTDLREGKVTLPLIYALQHSEGTQRAKIIDALLQTRSQTGRESPGKIQAESISTDDKFQIVVDFISSNGGLKFAKARAQEFGRIAQKALQDLPDSVYKQALLDLAEFAIHRDN